MRTETTLGSGRVGGKSINVRLAFSSTSATFKTRLTFDLVPSENRVGIEGRLMTARRIKMLYGTNVDVVVVVVAVEVLGSVLERGVEQETSLKIPPAYIPAWTAVELLEGVITCCTFA